MWYASPVRLVTTAATSFGLAYTRSEGTSRLFTTGYALLRASKRWKVFTAVNPKGRFILAFRRSTGSEQFRIGVPYDSGPSPPRLTLTLESDSGGE